MEFNICWNSWENAIKITLSISLSRCKNRPDNAIETPIIKCEKISNLPWSNFVEATEAIEAPSRPDEMNIRSLSWFEMLNS